MPRVFILGLDCLAPDLVFSRFWADLPNLQALAREGVAGPLYSCHPPITVPAWAAMVTGESPGSLGLYGFHDRADRSYHRRHVASSLSYRQPPVWTRLSRAGKRCRVLGVPQTYPPKPLNGYMVTGCLTPSHMSYATHPPHLRDALVDFLGEDTLDVMDFRSLSASDLCAALNARRRRLFNLANHWVRDADWDFFMMVDMGPDRLHHALWRYCMDDHPAFSPNHPLKTALRAYYVALDAHVGELCAHMRDDDVMLVVSDHGAQPMCGTFALNQWLWQRGYLALHQPPDRVTAFETAAVNWPATQAWADGGYVGRIYINMAGREPEGTVAAADAPALLARLTDELMALPNPFNGRCHQVQKSTDLYATASGVAPDLWVYLGGLAIRAIASLGHRELFGTDNDRGPDGANHAFHGVLIYRDGHQRGSGLFSIYDVAPTVLTAMGMAIPPSMVGKALGTVMEEWRCQQD